MEHPECQCHEVVCRHDSVLVPRDCAVNALHREGRYLVPRLHHLRADDIQAAFLCGKPFDDRKQDSGRRVRTSERVSLQLAADQHVQSVYDR